jgi:hypothetical protein
MDHIIESVGSFGKFQYRIIFIVGLVSALSSALIYVIKKDYIYYLFDFLFIIC